MFGIDWTYVIMGVVAGLLFIRWRLKKSLGGPRTIAVMSVNGVIKYDEAPDSLFAKVAQALGEVAEGKPKAVIVRINSPGGTVGASQAIYDGLLHLREKGIKVIALLEDVAASGGTYIAMAADQVIAHPGSITGSIGVIIQTTDLSAVLKRFDVKTNTIKSGDFKDILSFRREMRDDERKLLQGMVDDAFDQFCGVVAKGRALPKDKVKSFADGRVMTGRQALEVGLVDGNGGMLDAVALAERLCGIPEGTSVKRVIKSTPSPFKRLRLGFSAKSLIGEVLPETELSGVPLYLMPKF